MVADALHDVARHLRVEIVERQFHELHQEVGDERDVHTRVDVEHDPAADEADCELGGEERELGNEHKGDEAEVAVPDADIDEGLREEGEDELQQTAEHHAQGQLHELALVGQEISGEEQEVAPGTLFRLVVHGEEIGAGLEKEGGAHLVSVLACSYPALAERGFAIRHTLRRRVGNMK